jgi:hypothetical protein
MKKIVCDNCSDERAQSYKYQKNGSWLYKDLCVNCLQEFVLLNQVKLVEVHDVGNVNKRIIHG